MLAINRKLGKEAIEIKHRKQPLRATIIDNKLINIKEEHLATGRKSELDIITFIFYTITDKKWIEWLTRIFWKMFNNSIGAEKRLEELNKIF